MLGVVEEVRRQQDGELCGHVEESAGQWYALTVFGAVLGRHDTRRSAVDHVLAEGLASLAERWTLRHGDSGEEEVVCIQEANAAAVTVARPRSRGSVRRSATTRIARAPLGCGRARRGAS